MSNYYPSPSSVGLKTPFYVKSKQYEQGFLFALKDKKKLKNQHYGWSFNEGFKMGSLVRIDII